MQEKDVSTKEYFIPEVRVADFANGYFFKGQQLVKPEDVQDADSSVFGKIKWFGRFTIRQRYRDIVRKIIFGTRFVIIGVEEQSEIHFTMPVRAMGYDFLSYDMQLKKLRKKHNLKKDLRGKAAFLSGLLPEDKLAPAITVVLYYGSEPWTGPRSLHDMLKLEDFPEALREYVNDYPIHIFEVNRFEHLEYFKTDLRLVLGFLQNRNNDKKLNKFIEENESELSSIEEDAYDMISVMTHSEELSMMKKDYQTGGKIDMCKGLKDWMARERKEGEAIGEAKGEARGKAIGEASGEYRGKYIATTQMLELIRCMSENDATDQIPKLSQDKAFLEEMQQKYHLNI